MRKPVKNEEDLFFGLHGRVIQVWLPRAALIRFGGSIILWIAVAADIYWV